MIQNIQPLADFASDLLFFTAGAYALAVILSSALRVLAAFK